MDRSLLELSETLRVSQARWALVLDLLREVRNASDPDSVMRAAAAAVGEHLQVDRAGFFELADDGTPVFSAGWTAGRLPQPCDNFPEAHMGSQHLDSQHLDSQHLDMLRSGQTVVIGHTTGEGAVSLIAAPIIRNNQWRACFSVNPAGPRDWLDDEIALVREVGELTWDAVERIRAANALHNTEARLRLALDAAGAIGAWDLDLLGNRIYPDARCAYLLSVDPVRAAAGVPLSEYIDGIHVEDRDQVAIGLKAAIGTGRDYSIEYRVLPADGSLHWVHERRRFQFDRAGTPLRMHGVVTDVTERKQMEITLRQQWNKFDTVLSHTPDFTYTFDLEGRFSYANRALLSLLQKNLEEVVGKNFFELDYPPDLAARLQRQIQQVIDSRQTLRDQTPFTGASGNTGVYEYIFVPVLGEGGEVDAVAGSTRDITDRNQAEQLVEEDRRRWRDLLLHAPAGIALLRGPDHRFEWVNDEYVRLLARPAETFVGKTVREGVPEVEGQIYVGLLNGVYRSGQPFVGHESPLRLNRTDGSSANVYVNFVYMPTRNSAGEIDGVFVHVTDVTGIVEARRLAEESEHRFRQLADSMPQIVWTATPGGTLDYCNERWYQFTGLEHSLSGTASWDLLLHPDETKRVQGTWQSCLRSGEPYQAELRLWDRGEQRWRWFVSRAVAVRDAVGRIVKWFGTSTDIDEQKASQQALLHTQKLESVGLLAGGIAHDFNNLLVGIMGGASFALDTVPPSHPAYGMLRIIVESSDRAAHLTRQMLAYAGKGRLVIEAVNLSEMAAQTAQLVGVTIPKSVALRLELDDRLPSVESDQGQMQQVVMNLILNAAEAVGEKNGSIFIRTRTERVASKDVRRGIDSVALRPALYVVLEVEDTGCGIDPATLARIFDPFFTTKFTGRGLGLAAVAGVVRSHQGSIEVESHVGEGSTFRVLLPASDTPAAAAAPVVIGEIAKASETVLVIDDEEIVRRVLKAALEHSGYRTIIAPNGEKGLEYIRHDASIAVVFLDMSMPGLSGRQVLESLKTLRPALPVVVCSGFSEEEISREFSGLDIAGILPKPFTTKRLAAQVRSVLDAVNTTA